MDNVDRAGRAFLGLHVSGESGDVTVRTGGEFACPGR